MRPQSLREKQNDQPELSALDRQLPIGYIAALGVCLDLGQIKLSQAPDISGRIGRLDENSHRKVALEVACSSTAVTIEKLVEASVSAVFSPRESGAGAHRSASRVAIGEAGERHGHPSVRVDAGGGM